MIHDLLLVFAYICDNLLDISCLDPIVNVKALFLGTGIPILKLRQLWNLLIFMIRILLLARQHLYIETIPGAKC